MKNNEKRPNESIDLPQLRNKIVSSFNQEELNDLCFELGINPEEIPSGALSSRARELVNLFYRREDLVALLELLSKLRPKIDWMNLVSTTPNHKETIAFNYTNKFVPQIESEIRNTIDRCSLPVVFKKMVHYHFGYINEIGTIIPNGSNKYIRGIITLLACEACGEDTIRALPAAAAIEIAHKSTLVHDDIEDNSGTRRGRPTLWVMWGTPQAINAGTAMLFLSQKALSRAVEYGVSVEKVNEAKEVLNDSLLSVSQGQFFDMAHHEIQRITPEEYLQMIEFKTADLLRACGVIGAILGNADRKTINALGDFGKWLGISFQLRDDIEGIWGEIAEAYPEQSDLFFGKHSAPVVFASQKNPKIWDFYSSEDSSVTTVKKVKSMIEDTGGKKLVEDAADASAQKVFEALQLINQTTDAGKALTLLAKTLLGKTR